MTGKNAVLLITGLLVLLFVYTATSKLTDFEKYSGQMYNQPLPHALSQVLIWAVPLAELVAAALLLTSRYRRVGLWFSFLLMMTFSIYVGLILANTFRYVPCSCAGIFQRMSWKTHLIVNMALTVTALLGCFYQRRIENESSD
jgi:putative oxidoreductase